MSPAEVAASALRISLDEVVAVEPIKHGLTNESWLVRMQTDAVVVRISEADDRALRIDRASEAQILAAVAAAGIGAPVVGCDPTQRVLVTRYLGAPWSQEDASRDDNVRRLADLLRRLHALQPPVGVGVVDLLETVDGYLNTLHERDAGGDLTLQPMQDRAREAARQLRPPNGPRLCHNDVHHLNVVDADGLHLIDWEYAGAGEPLFDLASVCVYQNYDRTRQGVLLSAYVQRGGVAPGPRFESALWLFEYIRDLWTACREVSAAR